MTTIGERRYTVFDLERFPDDGNRYEVIDGELYVTAAPRLEHQRAISNIVRELDTWDPAFAHGCAFSGAGVIFSLENGVIPDLVWVSAARAAEVTRNPDTGVVDGKVHGAPDLAVEVLSPGSENIRRDRTIKLALYSRRDVREYWIVDRDTVSIDVYRQGDQPGLTLAATLKSGDVLTSPLLPGFTLSVDDVFRLPPWLGA